MGKIAPLSLTKLITLALRAYGMRPAFGRASHISEVSDET